jgi:type II secretory pathway pseudopilin PulG
MILRWQRGITLVELLVVFVITVVIAGMVFHFYAASGHMAAVAKAKGEAKGMAEIALRAMQKDIASSKAWIKTDSGTSTIELSFKGQGANQWTMLVPEKDSTQRVTYSFAKPELRREASGSSRVLCDHMEELAISSLGAGQIEIILKVGVIPSGQTQPQIHHQNLLVTIREGIETNLDARFRTTKDLDSF